MSVTIKKIPGIESVTASLNKGLATIQLKPGNSVSLEQILERVKNNGFTPKEAKVTALGQVLYTRGKLQLKIAGQNYEIDAPAVTSEELEKRVGETLIIEGVIPPSKDKKPPVLIHLKSFRNSSGL